MHKFLKIIEKVVDRLIPYLIIVLAILIIINFTRYGELYEPYILYIDYFIIFVFVLDLIFKWYRVKKVSRFLKLYWLDIIAVFPFYLLFRIYVYATGFFRAGEEAQKILHEALLLRESEIFKEARFVREAEYTLKEARPFIRILRFFQRGLRALKARFYITHANLVKAHLAHRKK